MQKYYVYFLLDPRRFYLPFYVGKGSGNRSHHHLTDWQKNTENPRKKAVIAKIRAAGLEPVIQHVAYFDDEDEAYLFEVIQIIRFGRRGIDEGGILTNLLVDNRPSVQRGPMSEATKEKIRLANTGKKRSPEISAKLSALRKGTKRGPPSQETIEKIRASNIGVEKRKWTDEEKAAHSERVKAQWRNPKRRLKQEAAFNKRRLFE